MKKWVGRILLAIVLIILIYIGTGWNDDISVAALKTRYSDDQSKYLPLNGLQVHYKDEGTGPTLVLVHGTASSLHTWDDWVELLDSTFRIVRMDIPAFGLTGPSADGDYSMDAYVKFIDNFTTKLGIDTFYLAGNSLGGEIAWNYAYAHTDRVRKMILIDAAGYPKEGPIPLVFKLPTIPVINKVMTKVTPRRLVAKSLRDVYYDDTKINDTLINRHFELLLRPGNRQAYVDRVQQIFKRPRDSYLKIKDIKTQTLIQWGEQDIWIPLSDAERFKEDLDNSVLKSYNSAGHVPMEEIPERTAKDAKAFLLGKLK